MAPDLLCIAVFASTGRLRDHGNIAGLEHETAPRGVMATMRNTLTPVFIVIGLVGLSAGCAQPPQAQIDAARAAATSAAADTAVSVYAPDQFAAMQDAQSALDAELAAQEAKFFLTRSYAEVEKLSATVEAAAKAATDAANVAEEQAKNDAMQLIADTKTALEAGTQALTTAPKGKGTEADLQAMQADLDGAATALTEAETALAASDYLEAKARAEAAKTAIDGVVAAVEAAKQARGGR